MRRLWFGFFAIAFIMFGSCSASNDNDNRIITEVDFESPSFLIGKWKVVGSYLSAGGPQYYVEVEDGETLDFATDGSFNSSEFSECSQGTYSIDGKELTLDYNCEAFNKKFPDLSGKFIYSISNETTFLLLSPVSLRCIEGCSTKYKKISN